MPTSTDSKYSATCLVSTWVSTHSWLVSTPHSVPSSCTLCQPVLIVSTSDKKYRFGVPFKVKHIDCSTRTVLWSTLSIATQAMGQERSNVGLIEIRSI